MRLQLYPRRDGEGALAYRDAPTPTANTGPNPTDTDIFTRTYTDLISSYTVKLGPTSTNINRPIGVDWPDEFWLSKLPASTTTTGSFSTSATNTRTLSFTVPPTPSSSSADGFSGAIFGYNDGPEEQELWTKFSTGIKAAIIIAGIFGIAAVLIACIWFCCGKPRRRKLKAEEDMVRYRARIDAERVAAAEGGDGVQVPLQTLSRENVNARERASIAPVAARGAVGRVAQRLSRHVSMRSNSTSGGHGLDVPPPQYEEHVPPAHQRLAGGMARRGGQVQNQNAIQPMVEEEEGMVADGKTPLSDIPFEDVVLTPTNRSQASSSQASGSASPSRDFGERHALGNGGGNTYGHTNA